VQENTNALKAAGFNIALDDFGTGNASISSLRYLKPNGIKFAREFVQDIHKDPELELITGSLISLAKGLGMGILCEGVEISAERDVLAKLGCSEFQGNLFGRPMAGKPVFLIVSDGALLHFKMQTIPMIGVRSGKLFVQITSQSRIIRNDNVPLIQQMLRSDQFGMELCFYCFEHQEVRN